MLQELRLLRCATRDRRLSRGDCGVYGVILEHCNKLGVAFPGATRLSLIAGLDVKNVKVSIKKLEKNGYLQVLRRGQRVSNQYQILIPSGYAQAPSLNGTSEEPGDSHAPSSNSAPEASGGVATPSDQTQRVSDVVVGSSGGVADASGGAVDGSGGVSIPASGGAGIPDLGAPASPELTGNSLKEELCVEELRERRARAHATEDFDDDVFNPDREVFDIAEALFLVQSNLSAEIFEENWVPEARGAQVRHFMAAMKEVDGMEQRPNTMALLRRVGEIRRAEPGGNHA